MKKSIFWIVQPFVNATWIMMGIGVSCTILVSISNTIFGVNMLVSGFGIGMGVGCMSSMAIVLATCKRVKNENAADV